MIQLRYIMIYDDILYRKFPFLVSKTPPIPWICALLCASTPEQRTSKPPHNLKKAHLRYLVTHPACRAGLLPVVMKAPPAGRADRPQRNERRCTVSTRFTRFTLRLSHTYSHTGPRYSQDSGHIRRVHRFDTSRAAACHNAFLIIP